MKVMMPNRLLQTRTHFYKPYVRYIVSDYELAELQEGAPKTQFKWSSFNSYERRYGGQVLNGQKAVICRHNAWGDQLIVSALARWLKLLWPNATIHQYCHADVMPLWLGNPFVEGSAIPLPMEFDLARNYDYHIFFEGMLEANSEPDQSNCYDDMFDFCGLESKTIPVDFKRPCIFPDPGDYKTYREVDPGRGYILYHAAPNNLNRAYPLSSGVEVVKQLALARPVVVVGTTLREYDVGAMFDALKGKTKHPVINLVGRTKSFREVIPFVEMAGAVVCPDSSIMHLAACFPEVPVVSLWGLFHPHDRMKYYKNNHPLFLGKDVCPSAPCHDHNFFLPVEQCKDAEPGLPKDQIKWCQALAGISVESVVAKTMEVMR